MNLRTQIKNLGLKSTPIWIEKILYKHDGKIKVLVDVDAELVKVRGHEFLKIVIK